MQVLKRLFLLLTPYWKTIIISSLLLIGRAGLELVPPLFQKEIIDEVITARNLTYLGIFITALIAAYALNQLVQIGDNYVRHSLGEKFIFDLRVRLYAYLQKMSLSFFERTSTGELMSRVTNDLSALEQFVTHGSALSAVDLMRLVGGMIILLILDNRLAVLVMIPDFSKKIRQDEIFDQLFPSHSRCFLRATSTVNAIPPMVLDVRLTSTSSSIAPLGVLLVTLVPAAL